MAGAIIENMSGRKLAMIGSVLILCQIICFLVGAVFSPAPNNSDQFLATKVPKQRICGIYSRVSNPYSFYTDPEPAF
jgi:hypothetical protein